MRQKILNLTTLASACLFMLMGCTKEQEYKITSPTAHDLPMLETVPDVKYWTDRDTGCEYLIFQGGQVVPRGAGPIYTGYAQRGCTR